MTNAIHEIEMLCLKKGTTVRQICLKLNENPSTISRWKRKPPKYVQMLQAMGNELAKMDDKV